MIQSDVVDLIHPGLQKIIQDKGWKSGLSPIQKIAIPTILTGTDCIIEAPTAGGKTEAVLFPTLTKAAQNKKSSVQILYLAPLRALLNDIELRAEEYSKACGLHYFKWHGDVGQKEKINAFQNPHQILLTTPESLEAILLRKAGWQNFFSGLEYVIIDEAHNFAACDRGSHLVSLLERLETKIHNVPQRIALTATIGNPDAMLDWLSGRKRPKGKRIHVRSSTEKPKDYKILFFDPLRQVEDKPETQSAYRRLKYLYELLPLKKSIVFGGSRRNSEAIATAINQLNLNHKRKVPVNVRTHHSAVSKFYREYAESHIKIKNDLEGSIDSIISTSTLELGIDIGELDQIIQLDSLSSSSAFLQRVGRTGRRENKPQFFRGLCTKKDDFIILTSVVSLGRKGISEKIQLPQKAFHIMAHQLVCLCLQHYGINPNSAWEVLHNISCFSQIKENEFHNLIDFMLKEEYLRKVDGELVIGETGEKSFLSSNWRNLFAVFESGPVYEVYEGKKHIGTLDSAFVEVLDAPFHFVLGGIEWEAYNIKTESRIVFVKKSFTGDAPKWVTFNGLDVPFETAKEAGKLLFSDSPISFLSDEATEVFSDEREKLMYLAWTNEKWVIELFSKKVFIWTFAGDRINRTLSNLITSLGIGKASSSYENITIKNTDISKDEMQERISKLFSTMQTSSQNDLELFANLLKKSFRLVPFSKFAKCLPETLWAEALSERVFDFEGLINEVKSCKLEYFKTKV